MLETRIHQVQYMAKKDSSLVRTVYSNVRIDGNDPMFDFKVPADAKPVKSSKAGKK